MADLPPNQTLYVKNLCDKIKKEKLKESLYYAFSRYGRVIDIVACRGDKLRGQAWVVFEDINTATNAMRGLQGFPFYNKNVAISYAIGESEAVARKKGAFEPRSLRKQKLSKQKGAARGPLSMVPSIMSHEKKDPASPTKANANEMIPSNLLVARELPMEIDEAGLKLLFGGFHNFKEVRMVPGSKGIALIDFLDIHSATTALQGLNNFKLTPTERLKLSYGKQ